MNANRPEMTKPEGNGALEFYINVATKETEMILNSLPKMVEKTEVEALIIDPVQFFVELGPMRLGIPYIDVATAVYFDYFGYMAHELGVAEIRSFLDTAKTSDSLEHKLYKVGSLIFAYGKEQRVLVLNPFYEIDRPKIAYRVPEILEPAQFKTLLETAEEEVPELIPFLAMAGFAGVRRSELVREYAEDQVLKWEDVDWQKQLITVRHEVAKQTSRKMGNRRFIPMEAALLHWLGPYRKQEGLLIPLVDSAVRRRMKELRLRSKVNPPNNAFRHSYASCWLVRSSKEGLGELSKRMGNSEAVCKRHYLETLTREEGKSWFALRRSTGAS